MQKGQFMLFCACLCRFMPQKGAPLRSRSNPPLGEKSAPAGYSPLLHAQVVQIRDIGDKKTNRKRHDYKTLKFFKVYEFLVAIFFIPEAILRYF